MKTWDWLAPGLSTSKSLLVGTGAGAGKSASSIWGCEPEPVEVGRIRRKLFHQVSRNLGWQSPEPKNARS